MGTMFKHIKVRVSALKFAIKYFIKQLIAKFSLLFKLYLLKQNSPILLRLKPINQNLIIHVNPRNKKNKNRMEK